MEHVADVDVLDKLLSPLSQCFTPGVAKQIAALQADPTTQARIEELANKSTEDALSEEERMEYETYVQAIDFIAILQSKARYLLFFAKNHFSLRAKKL